MGRVALFVAGFGEVDLNYTTDPDRRQLIRVGGVSIPLADTDVRWVASLSNVRIGSDNRDQFHRVQSSGGQLILPTLPNVQSIVPSATTAIYEVLAYTNDPARPVHRWTVDADNPPESLTLPGAE